MSSQSIYQYIIENIDEEEENFIQATLPDEPHPSVPHPLGAEDAFWFSSNAPSDTRAATEVLKLLQAYQVYPDQPHKQKLYEGLARYPIIALAEPICDKLQGQDISEDLLALARSFFYNAQHRGPIKFSYIILGLYGVERIKKENPDLWEDMIKVAQCEEFTYFFLFSCNLTNTKPFKEIWRLIGCTEGWGKVFAVEAAECRDEAQDLWLIQHGMEVSVDYPPLAGHILEAAHLPFYLEQEEIDERTFKGAGTILNGFLLILDNLDESVLEEIINTSVIRPVQLFSNYLRHAKRYAVKPENLLQVLNLSFGLRNLEQNEDLCLIAKNDIERLIADCDTIIYAQDWQQYIKNNLVQNDSVNYDLCDFACEMDIDIWKPLFDYLCNHPFEYKAMPYLFSYNDENYQQMMLHFVEHNLKLYRMEEAALLVPLRYLAHKPGIGEQIVITALTSMYDWPRGIACAVLSEWGEEYISEPIRTALQEALALSNNSVVSARIEALLTGKRFKVEDLFHE